MKSQNVVFFVVVFVAMIAVFVAHVCTTQGGAIYFNPKSRNKSCVFAVLYHMTPKIGKNHPIEKNFF